MAENVPVIGNFSKCVSERVTAIGSYVNPFGFKDQSLGDHNAENISTVRKAYQELMSDAKRIYELAPEGSVIEIAEYLGKSKISKYSCKAFASYVRLGGIFF